MRGVVTASDTSKQTSDEGADPIATTLQQIEELDGNSRAALAADLEKVPPSLRPLVLSQLEAVAKRGQEEQTGRETKSPPKPPAPPQSRAIAAQDKRPESGRSEPAEEEPKARSERTACVQCSDEVVPARPSQASGRNTSPFDRLAALARAEDREQADESRKAADAIARVDAAAGNRGTGNRGTGNRETGNRETGNRETGNRETGNRETGNRETGNRETGNRETGNRGTGIQRAGHAATPASYVLKSEDSRTWQNALDEAIEKLESATPPEASSDDAVADLARLRLLQLAAGRRSEALAPIPALSADADAFFTKTLFGLDVWLDNRRIAEEDRRAAAASPHLTEAIGHLGEVAPLSVRNLQLCTAVQSFGVVEPFKTVPSAPVRRYSYTPRSRTSIRRRRRRFRNHSGGAYSHLR